MKKRFYVYLGIIAIILTAITPAIAYADEKPTLESIELTNAQIQNGFSPEVYEYTIILDDNSITPSLDSYAISGEAQLFISYNVDAANHQTALIAELKYSSGSTIYTFNYGNPASVTQSSDNTLSSIYCSDCELEPSFSSNETNYRLYIPSDMTQLIITPVPTDSMAYAPKLELTLNQTQEPVLSVMCTATDGSQKEYKLRIKRAGITLSEIREKRLNGEEFSLSDGNKFYRNPEFAVICIACIAGLIILLLLFRLTKRITAKAYNENEKPFYANAETNE